jgi:hypothetical protein
VIKKMTFLVSQIEAKIDPAKKEEYRKELSQLISITSDMSPGGVLAINGCSTPIGWNNCL